MLEVMSGVIAFVALMMVGLPVFAAMVVGATIMIFLLKLSPTLFLTTLYHAVDSFILLAIPLFILAGNLMTEGGLAERLVAFANSLVGKIKGGLGHVVIVATLFFGAVTGSTLATAAAIGSILIPRMTRHGYDRGYSAALVASCSFLGSMIPPSIPGIVYAWLANVSVGAVFLATAIPGVIIGIGYMIVNYFIASKWMHPVDAIETSAEHLPGGLKGVARAGYAAIPALFMPVVILGGIYGGVFTPTEAAAVAVAYALLVGFLLRRLRFKNTFESFLHSGTVTCAIALLVGPALVLSGVLASEGMAKALAEFTLGLSRNAYLILVLLNVLLLFLGMFMDAFVIKLIMVPLLVPLFVELHLNLIHMGSVLLLNLGLGTITPPFAFSLFITSGIADVPFHKTIKPTLYFLFLVGIPVLILVTYFPDLSLWLPSLVFGRETVYGVGG